MKIYYKVLHRTSSLPGRQKLWSATMRKVNNGDLCREYKPGRWTKPAKVALELGYGLTCFTDTDQAFRFIDCNLFLVPDASVWECQIGRQLPLPSTFYFFTVTLEQIKANPSHISFWPPGTVMTDKIKLIREVQ